MCSGMHVFLRGCLTDLVSKSEVGQNVDRSRMEQTGEEWLSNHPKSLSSSYFPHYPPAACSSCAAALGQPGSVWRGSVWGGGTVRSPCCWPLGWEDRGETLGPVSQLYLLTLNLIVN